MKLAQRIVSVAVAGAVLIGISACGSTAALKGQQIHIPGSTSSAGVLATPSATAPESSTATNGSPEANPIRVLHSASNLTDDMKLSPGQCHAKVIDASKGLILPDPSCTPGAIDPAVTQDNLKQTICRSGYTSEVRAPSSQTSKMKVESTKQYGMTYDDKAEYDHLISLQLGGTNSTSNLWVEPNKDDAKGTTNPKDAIENRLNAAVCTGKVTLAAAQKAIATDWTTADQVLGLR